MVERRVLLPIPLGQIDGERGHVGEPAAGLRLVALGDVGVRELARLRRVAVESERELTAAARALGVIVERPLVARAVVADGGGTKLAGEERRDERAAALVPARDEPHGQAGAVALAIQVQAQRAGGAPAAAGLLGPEEAEEDAAAGGGFRQGERPRRAELVIERQRADLVGVVRRLRGPRDPAPRVRPPPCRRNSSCCSRSLASPSEDAPERCGCYGPPSRDPGRRIRS